MVELCPKVNNITIIHLSGGPNSVFNKTVTKEEETVWKEAIVVPKEEEIVDLEDKKEFEYDEMKYLYNILNEDYRGRSFCENLRYFYLPSYDISNQNVGISGGISMVSDPKYLSYDDQQFNSFEDDENVGPYSLVSVHESIVESLNSFQHYTTITIGKRHETKMDSDESVNVSKFRFTENNSKNVVKNSHASQTEIIRPVMMHKEMQVCLDNLQCDNTRFEHEFYSTFSRDIIAQDIDNDRESLSSFSSAYTVTECELATSDASTNSYFPKELYNYKLGKQINNLGSYEFNPNILNEDNFMFNIFSKKQSEKLKYDYNKFSDDMLVNLLFHESRKSKYKYSTYADENPYFLESDYSYLDQRDKSEEEMWVSNEATYSQSLPEFALQLIPPPISPIFPRKAEPQPKVQHEGMEWSLSAVPFDQSVSEGVSRSLVTMTALMASECDVSLHRNHFTNRQRIGESLSIEVNALKDSTWNKENESKSVNSTADLTSTADNRPTKRFSFLVRNNSVDKSVDLKQNPACDTKCGTKNDNISASDKAILDRLSELKITQTPSNHNVIKPIRSQTTPVTPSAYSLSQQPPCGRCEEPVYPQELIKPTEELYFHIACFKCHQCGLRLNLRTFFRSPSPTKGVRKENRIYCRIHLPGSDLRPNYPENQSNTVDQTKEVIKCDPVGLKYF